MIYGSICSGIEAATVAWHPLGWRPAFFSEIEKFPRAVLEHHYPDVPLHGDFTTIGARDYEPIDLLVGGTPCQSFSIAGLRGGLDDDRGQLSLEFCRLAQRTRPRWVVWENVPGVLSKDDGRAFASILGGLAECGYGLAYRVLDAQYVRVQSGFSGAVPQRRRRVFVVGYIGDWRRAAAVLFEREGMRRDTPPRREAGQNVAPTISARPSGGGGLGTDFDCDGGLIPEISDALQAKDGRGVHSDMGTFVAHTLRGKGYDASEDGTGRGTPIIPEVSCPLLAKGNDSFDDTLQSYVAFSCKDHGNDAMNDVAPTMRAMGHSGSHANAGGQLAVAIQERAVCENPDAGPGGAGVRDDGAAYTLEARTTAQSVAFDMRGREGGAQFEGPHETANIRAASGGSSRSYVAEQWAVRRLTPLECERLQGFPDGYTDAPYRKRNWTPDGPRYKALGNSMAVNVMRWIGQRIQAVEQTK